MPEFVCPPKHRHFKALALSGRIDENIRDCAIAYIAPSGGGPDPDHVHPHDHLFTVVAGAVVIRVAGAEHVVQQGQALRVPGRLPHSVWNRGDSEAKVIGVSLEAG